MQRMLQPAGGLSSERPPLMCQQQLLELDAARGAEADEAPAGAENAMARHDYRPRIPGHRAPDRAGGARTTDLAGDLAVGARRASRDTTHGPVDGALELARAGSA